MNNNTNAKELSPHSDRSRRASTKINNVLISAIINNKIISVRHANLWLLQFFYERRRQFAAFKY